MLAFVIAFKLLLLLYYIYLTSTTMGDTSLELIDDDVGMLPDMLFSIDVVDDDV